MFKEHRCETLGRTLSAQHCLLGGKEFSKRKGETKNKILEGSQPLTHRLWGEEQARSRARRYREPRAKRPGRARVGQGMGEPFITHLPTQLWANGAQVMLQLISIPAQVTTSSGNYHRPSLQSSSAVREGHSLPPSWEVVRKVPVAHGPSSQLLPAQLELSSQNLHLPLPPWTTLLSQSTGQEGRLLWSHVLPSPILNVTETVPADGRHAASGKRENVPEKRTVKWHFTKRFNPSESQPLIFNLKHLGLGPFFPCFLAAAGQPARLGQQHR